MKNTDISFGAVIVKRVVSASVLLLLTMSAFSQESRAQSHALINNTKSGENNIFISQGFEGEYGTYNRIQSGDKPNEGEKRLWRGYGIRNGFGIELQKFVQFSLSHTMLSMRSKANSYENILGSRLSTEAKAVFSSPLGNVEAGGGLTGSQMNYQHDLERANFMGSGYYYYLGINHYISSVCFSLLILNSYEKI